MTGNAGAVCVGIATAGHYGQMANPKFADYVRERPPINARQAAQLLGVSERSVARMIEAGTLAASKLGDSLNAPYVLDLGDVLVAHARRKLGEIDLLEDATDHPLDDPGLFDRTEAKTA